MGSQDCLITLYLYVCQQYKEHMKQECQRISNNAFPEFTDEEVLTVYLFGILQRRWTIKDIYNEIRKHWAEWFPSVS